MRPQLVEVDWIDATHDNTDGVPLSEVATHYNLAQRTTSGYLVHKDDEKVVIASNFEHDPDDHNETRVECAWCIPAGWVKEIRHATRQRKRSPGAAASPGLASPAARSHARRQRPGRAVSDVAGVRDVAPQAGDAPRDPPAAS